MYIIIFQRFKVMPTSGFVVLEIVQAIIIIIIIIYCITQTNIMQQYKKYRYMQMVQAKS